MYQVQLICSNKVMLEDASCMQLDYCLTESISEEDHEKSPYYGIKISKYHGGTEESDEIAGLSASRDNVISILKKLHRYEVTPISMVEIIDELVTLES